MLSYLHGFCMILLSLYTVNKISFFGKWWLCSVMMMVSRVDSSAAMEHGYIITTLLAPSFAHSFILLPEARPPPQPPS